jgi:hypothetical protein
MSTLAYCWPQSAVAGDEIALHLSGTDAEVAVEVVRDGLEPLPVWSARVHAPVQALPEGAPEHGCDWHPSTTIVVGDDWPSGCYVVHVDGDAPTAWFVVRSSVHSPRRPLLKLATNTWNAYNDVGERNLYTGAVHASPCRPLAAGFLAKPAGPGDRVVDDAGEFLVFAIDAELSLWHGMSGWAGQERRFVRWAEAAGIELDYAIDADLDGPRGAELLRDRSLLLSVGHDEYWTWAMRDSVEGFVASGGHVLFLSGNTCYWQVRLEDDDRRMVAWKHRYAEDPVLGTDEQHLTTTMWADPLTGRPEATLTGVTFTRGGYHHVHRSAPRGARGYEVHRPAHWLFEGTELERGDLLGTEHGVVGYECDGCDLTLVDGLPTATTAAGTPEGFEVLATAPATAFDAFTTPLPLSPGSEYELEFHARRLLGDDSPEHCAQLRHGHAVLGTWSHSSGGTVVTTGCTDWAYGLEDPLVDRITRNAIDRLA